MPNDLNTSQGLLSGIRVLDVSGFEGMYGARLLADLGADVVRVELDDVEADAAPGPYVSTSAGESLSAFSAFVNLNKRVVHVDLGELGQRVALQRLIDSSDIVLANSLPEGLIVPPGVSLVETSVFGHLGSGDDYVGSDLVGLAAGGLLSLGGYPDTAPVAVFGNQAYLCGGIMTGVAAVLSLLCRVESQAPRVDVSVQATLVGALEDATAEFDLRGTVRRRAGDQQREAGTGIFRSADGYVSMVAGKLGTAQAWLNLVAWLQEMGVEGADELGDPAWTTIEKRRDLESLEKFMAIFESYSTIQTSEWLYREGQRRSIAIAPVNKMSDVLSDPQLRYRDFFRSISSSDFATELVVPGKPYRLFDLPDYDSWSLARDIELADIEHEWLSPDPSGPSAKASV
jgi:benzylsuccinate CoA-transferase BbsE subunit